MEQLGTEPNPDEMPMELGELPMEVQQAVYLFNILPDLYAGMDGTWIGKSFSGLLDIMNIFEMEHHRDTFEYVLVCISEASKHYANQRSLQGTRKR